MSNEKLVHESKNNDTIFINAFEPKRKEVFEYFNKVLFRNYYIFCFSICVAHMVISIAIGRWSDAIRLVVIVLAIVGVAGFVRFRQTEKLFEVQFSSGAIARIKSFNSAFIEIGEGRYEYSHVTKTVNGKKCLFLVVEKSLTIIIKKDAFTKGDYESFVEFLKEKLKDNPKALKGLRKA